MKKKLLIYWVTRTFVEIFKPLIPEMARDFEIVVMLSNYSTPPGTIGLLDFWKKQGIIKEYLITPHHKEIFKIHLFMKSAIKKLKPYKFDLWLSGSATQVIERYIQECILPENCVSVIVWHNITYLFMYNASFAENLLQGRGSGGILQPVKNQQLGSGLCNKSLAERIKQARSFADLSRKAVNCAKRFFKLRRKKLCAYCDRVIFPLLLSGRTFRLGPYDNLTQIGSGRSKAFIFTDEIEAQAHKALFENSNIYTARYPTQGSCRCNNGQEKGKTAVLSPLSGFVGHNEISQEVLDLFYRDFKTVLLKTGAESVHLRVHPDEVGRWYVQLRDYLVGKGIKAKIVDSQRPIREVMCDYLGMAGYASASLRDARASCDYAFVVGFTAISKFQFRNPKSVFGRGEGIGWIEEDGSCDKAIFNREKYIPPSRKSLPDILRELSAIQG